MTRKRKPANPAPQPIDTWGLIGAQNELLTLEEAKQLLEDLENPRPDRGKPGPGHEGFSSEIPLLLNEIEEAERKELEMLRTNRKELEALREFSNKIKEGAKRGGRQNPKRDLRMAWDYQQLRRKHSSISDSAIKEHIGRKYNLKRRAAIDAVNRGLKNFVR
jgi:hypothetical protein